MLSYIRPVCHVCDRSNIPFLGNFSTMLKNLPMRTPRTCREQICKLTITSWTRVRSLVCGRPSHVSRPASFLTIPPTLLMKLWCIMDHLTSPTTAMLTQSVWLMCSTSKWPSYSSLAPPLLLVILSILSTNKSILDDCYVPNFIATGADRFTVRTFLFLTLIFSNRCLLFRLLVSASTCFLYTLVLSCILSEFPMCL